MSHWQEGMRKFALGSLHRVNPARSLPARLSIFVFGVALVISFLVSGISVYSVDRFLREKVEQNFPKILERTGERLDLWHDQRLLELDVFAESAIVRENIERLLSNRKGRTGVHARREAEQYLSYVLASFTHFETLFVLGEDGEELLWVGQENEFGDPLFEGIDSKAERGITRVIREGGQILLIASSPIHAAQNKPLGTLHAVIQIETIGSVLQGQNLGETGHLYLLDPDGHYLGSTTDGLESGVFSKPPPSVFVVGQVVDYRNESGDRVVGSARVLPRYDWTLIVEERYSDAFAPVFSGMKRVLTINIGIVLLFGFAAFRVARSIVKPIEALSDAARRISEGEKNVEIPRRYATDEVGLLTRTITEMTTRLENNARELQESQNETQKAVDQMREQNVELQRVNEILEQLSITDGLTKLHNHRYFQEQLEVETRRATRSGGHLVLVLIDIDHFKNWNDRLGHAAGDEILRRIAEVMLGIVRETDLLARYGGEEFALILPNTSLDGAVALAEKIRIAVSETEILDSNSDSHDPVTVSIGIGVYRGEQKALFNDADQALYRAKSSGRDCVMVEDTT